MKTNDKFSLIIIGGGITGLSTGITWAKNIDCSEKLVLIFLL